MRLRSLIWLGLLALPGAPAGAGCPATWTHGSPPGPGGRYSFAMDHDRKRGLTLLFGGADDANRSLGDTWGWDGETWWLLATTGPRAGKTATMVYDVSRERLVLFGGATFTPAAGNVYETGTWEWNGTAWERRATTGPSGRCCQALAYDAARARVLFGGDVNGTAQDDTWEWDGAAWTRRDVARPRPAARHSHAMTYDAARGRVVLFGGLTSAGLAGDTWEWDGTRWQERPGPGPPARLRAGFTYDGARGVAVLVGGDAASGLADTVVWELFGSGWSAREASGMSPRSGHGAAYDALRRRLVVFGGSTDGPHAADTWERRAPAPVRRLVPIVLDVLAGTARFTTELSLTNPGPAPTDVMLSYAAALGSEAGSGSVRDRVGAGEQRGIPDALAYLRSKGLPIPAATDGQQGGTLLVTFDCVEPGSGAAVTARTTTPTVPPAPGGAAGLAYGGIDPAEGSAGKLRVPGLRADAADRSNVAVFGTTGEPVTVRVTAISGAGDGTRVVLEDALALGPYGWRQLSFGSSGLVNGTVLVERTAGSGLFGAYGVVNDNATNDGSFLSAVPVPAPTSVSRSLFVPALVETSRFRSELVLSNPGDQPATLSLQLVETLAGPPGSATVPLTLAPREQRIVPDAIDFLRTAGASVGPRGPSYAGALRISVDAGPADLQAGARTAAQAPGGGQLGLYTPAVTADAAASEEALLYGLRADDASRSNVAAVNVGEPGDGPVTLAFQAHDGESAGASAGSPEERTLAPGQWVQLDGFLSSAGVKNGWVRVRRTSGSARWIAYGVVNDGARPGERTGDGAYVPMVLPP